MIVGDDIVKRGFIKLGKRSRLKNGTFDLTIGDIFPVGAAEANARNRLSQNQTSYTIEPQEMVWVLSSEEFKMPDNITGLATLRTTFTHQGLLALNVGIIDSHFEGKISSAIINFSSVRRTINVGDAFFRIIFFEHDNVKAPYVKDKASTYLDVNKKAAGEFPKNFMNLPGDANEYYGNQLTKLVKGFVISRPLISSVIGLFLVIIFLGSIDKILPFLDALGLIDEQKLQKLIAK